MSDISEKIASAKKEAEVLKEKIKQRKDSLADTTRMLIVFWFVNRVLYYWLSECFSQYIRAIYKSSD